MIALDTETNGLDHYHGTQPYFVTICSDEGTQWFWEWDVDPLTRKVNVLPADVEHIRDVLKRVAGWGKWADDVRERNVLVGQNAKFDAAALATIGITEWPWGMTRDTVVAGHILASNHRHDLTAMVLEYLNWDISPYENALEEACVEARRRCRQHRPHWRIAKEGYSDMPSLKGSSGKGEKDRAWKYDAWLPRALAAHLDYPKNHPWYTVLSNYANVDSAATIALWPVMRDELHRRGLWPHFLQKMRLPSILLGMERRGISVNGAALDSLEKDFSQKSVEAEVELKGLARSYNYDLVLPKGAVNNSLKEFAFDILQLEPVYNKKAKSDSPSFDTKVAIPYWLATLPTECDQRQFITTLVEKRRVDTALGFIASYRRFWLPNGQPGWYVIHPTYGQTTTDTTRMSCYNPNGQQISKKEETNLRRGFAPAPGRELWSIDAKNIELRIPAYLSKEADLIDLFERSKEPPFYGSQHLLNFSVVYDDLWVEAVREVGLDKAGPHCKSKYESTWYQWVKNGDFAIQYNCGQATADQAFHKYGSFRLLKQKFAKLEALNQKCIATARKYGWVETLPQRSVDPYKGYPLLVSRSEYGDVLPTTPLNYVVQGTAGEWMHGAMIRVEDYLQTLRRKGVDAWMILTVHDELVFDFSRGAGAEPWKTNLPYVREIQQLMELGGEEIGIPTPVTVEYHSDNWGKGMVV